MRCNMEINKKSKDNLDTILKLFIIPPIWTISGWGLANYVSEGLSIIFLIVTFPLLFIIYLCNYPIIKN